MIPIFISLRSSQSCVAKSPLTALTGGQFVYFLHLHMTYSMYDELGNPIPVSDDERLIPQINQNYANFTPVIGINSTRSIENGYAVLEGKTAPGPHFSPVFLRQGNGDAGGDEAPTAWCQGDFVRFQTGEEVHS